MTDREELIAVVTRRLDADEDVHAYADTDLVDERLTTVVAAVADALIAEGWRPPLPEQAEGRSPWDAYVAAYRAYQETNPHGARVHPTAHHMHALEAALRVAGSPLPDSETEWGWKPDPDEPDEVICSTDEQAARERVGRASYRKLARREVGPWTEVQ